MPKNESPLVSVVVPIYNTEKYLRNCLDSIIAQTHQNLEILLVDDGSTDSSGKISDSYAKKDKRIKVIHQKNGGQSSARNHGLKEVSGEYVSFIDSDDEIAPDFYEKHLKLFDNETSVTVCGAFYKKLRKDTARNVYVNPLRKRRKHESKKAYILYLLAIDGRMYWSVNKLFRANVAKKCKFDESINFAEDTKFVLDYLNLMNGEPKFVLEPLYIYNFGTETSTIKSAATKWENWKQQYKDLKSWLGPHPSLSEFFWLHTVRLRWRVSYVRSCRRAKS